MIFPGCFVFHRVSLPVIDSTQQYAQEHARDVFDYPVGQWRLVVADQQLAGQGTQGRSWYSPPGNIYVTFSTLAPLSQSASKKKNVGDIPQVVGVAVMRVLQTFGVQPQYKWVNDILVNEKKIAGILCQTGGSIAENILLHIGIGLNIALKQEECDRISQPTTSLNLLLNQSFDRDFVLDRLANSVAYHFDQYLHHGREFMQEILNEQLAFKGKKIIFNPSHRSDGSFEGIIIGVGQDGALLVQDVFSSEIKRCYSGSIG